jgi:hypothetical protein
MAQTIKIKRSSSTAAPTSLSAGELAYSSNSQKLFVGAPSDGTVTTIGGDLYVNMLDHTAGTLTASSAIIVDSSSKINELKSGNIVVTGSSDTISTSSGALTISASGNLVLAHGGTLDLDNQATSLTIIDNQASALDINEGGNSYIKCTTTNSGEKVVIGQDIEFADDVSLLSDGAILNFGADSDVNLTHVADTGLLLNSSRQLQFGDSGTYIHQSADGVLDLVSDSEIEINGTTIDINGAVDISGTTNSVGNLSVNTDKFTVNAGEGNTSISGTLAVTNAATMSSSLTVSGATTLNGNITLGNASSDTITITGTPTFTPSADFDGGFTVAGSQTVDMGSNRVRNVATPTATTDAANKGYVDSVKQALDIKDSVVVATVSNFSSSYDNSAGTLTADSNGAISIDGVSLTSGQRVLVKDQTTGTQNGIYSVTTVGDGSTAAVLTRTTDADSSSEVTGGMFTFVESGTVNADNAFVLTSVTGGATLGTDTLTFTQFSGAGQVTAGSGLAKSGNTLSVNVDNTSIEIVSDTLQIKGLDDAISEGDLIFGANGGNQFTTLAIGTYDSTNSVGQVLQVGNNGTVTWSNTLDGGTF